MRSHGPLGSIPSGLWGRKGGGHIYIAPTVCPGLVSHLAPRSHFRAHSNARKQTLPLLLLQTRNWSPERVWFAQGARARMCQAPKARMRSPSPSIYLPASTPCIPAPEWLAMWFWDIPLSEPQFPHLQNWRISFHSQTFLWTGQIRGYEWDGPCLWLSFRTSLPGRLGPSRWRYPATGGTHASPACTEYVCMALWLYPESSLTKAPTPREIKVYSSHPIPSVFWPPKSESGLGLDAWNSV